MKRHDGEKTGESAGSDRHLAWATQTDVQQECEQMHMAEVQMHKKKRKSSSNRNNNKREHW
jgi:hypothetical protein